MNGFERELFEPASTFPICEVFQAAVSKFKKNKRGYKYHSGQQEIDMFKQYPQCNNNDSTKGITQGRTYLYGYTPPPSGIGAHEASHKDGKVDARFEIY